MSTDTFGWESRASQLPSGRWVLVWFTEFENCSLVIDHVDDGPYFWRAVRGGNSLMNSAATFVEARTAAYDAARRLSRSDEEWHDMPLTGTDEFDPAEWSSESELTLEAMRAELEGRSA